MEWSSRFFAPAMAAAVICVVAAAEPGVAVAAPAGANHKLEIQAREAFASGNYEEALSLFAKLYAETLHPVYLRNIARCHQKMKQPDKAIDTFNDYLAKAKGVTAAERKEIHGYIKQMEDLRAEQAASHPAGTGAGTATADGQPPPAHGDEPSGTSGDADKTEPAHGDAKDTETKPPPDLTVKNEPGTGGSPPLVTPPPEPSSPIYTRWWFWTGIAAVVAGGVVAVVLLRKGSNCPASQCM